MNEMSEDVLRIQTPLSGEVVERLRIGDRVLLSGPIYSARDAAHHRMVALIRRSEPLPFELKGQVIYYVGPSPPLPGQAVGAAGPTSSYRMDAYAPLLMEMGLKGMIGKGARSQAVKDAMKRYPAVYFAAIGGAGALISKCIISAEVVAYPELGTEAVRKMVVQDFPLIVANDCRGGDLYESGSQAYRM